MAFLILYAVTASPSIGWRDAPEFAVTTNSLGIAHPAGFPTYSLITKAFTNLPLGSIPFRATLGVAFFAAVSLWILYILVYRWYRLDNIAYDTVSYRAWVAAGTAIAFGLTQTLWVNSTENEVYTLNLLIIGLIFYCTLRWSSGDGEAWLYSGALLYGLAAGNHGSVAFYAPGFLVFFLIRAGSDRWRKLLLVFFFFLVGFSVYLYLPIRSAASPPIDLGNPETWKRFLMHITDRKDSMHHFSSVREGGSFFNDTIAFARFAVPWWFWPFVLPLVLVGLWRTAKTDKALAGLIVYIILFNIFFFIKWSSIHSNYLPTYFLAAYLAGIGMIWILSTLGFLKRLPKFRTAIMSVMLIGLFAGGSFIGYLRNNRSTNYLSYEVFRSSFETLPPDSITIATALWPFHMAYQDVYRIREDLTVMLLADFAQPNIFNPITSKRFPRIKIPNTTNVNGVDKISFTRFLDVNFQERLNIFWDASKEDIKLNLVPGPVFLMQFQQTPQDRLTTEMVQRVFNNVHKELSNHIESRQIYKETWIGPYYYRYLSFLADYLKQSGRISDSISVYKSIIELLGPNGIDSIPAGDLAIVYNEWSVSLYNLKRYDEALSTIAKAIEILPDDSGILYNIGLFLFYKGETKQAEEYFLRVLALEETDLALFMMGMVRETYGHFDEATAYYEKALKVTVKKSLRDEIEARLKTIWSKEIH